MILSIVTTMYYSSDYIEEFHNRISKEAEKITDDYEIIFVDDGSPDDSLKKAVKIHERDDKVKVIELSRNFGHHKAIMTGLSYAEGEYVFLIDCDLEEEPELLSVFWKEIQNYNKFDVIYGVQKKRKGGYFEKLTGFLYYKIFNYLSSSVYIEPNFLTVRIMKQNYVKKLLMYKEKDFYFAPICYLAGFKQKKITVKKLSHSKTTYNFFKKYHMLINSIFAFSEKPLYFIFYTGLIIMMLSFLFVIKIVINKLFFSINVDGWTSIIASIWLIGGIVISFLGIIAIYASKMFIETKNRPFSIIKNVYTKE